MKALLTLTTILFTSVFLVAQTTHSWKTNYGTWITESLDLSDGRLLLGGYEREIEYELNQTNIYLSIYNTTTQEVTSINPFNIGVSGQVTDIEKANGHIYVLYNLFGSPNFTGYDVAIGKFDLNMELIDLRGYISKGYNQLYIESMHVLSDSVIYLGGSHGRISHDLGMGFYFGIVNQDSIIHEFNDDFKYDVLGIRYGAYFNSDVISLNEKFTYVSQGLDYHDGALIIDFEEPKVEKSHKFPTTRNEVNGGIDYRTIAVENIEFINDSILFSSNQNYRTWALIENKEVQFYDTVEYGGLFFSLNPTAKDGDKVDSIKFVTLTNEYGYPTNGPGGSDVSEEIEFICLTATVNNVDEHLTYEDGSYGDDTFVDWYPDQDSETGKIVTAKLNIQGDIIWKRIMDEPGAYWIAHQAVANKDGGCTVIGGRYKQGETFLHDPLIIRYDSVGTTTSIQENAKTTLETSVYPQPAINSVSIQWPAQQLAKSTITIYNNQGKQIHLYSTSYNNNLQINVANWLNGVYFFRIHQSNGETFSGKLMVER